MDDGTFVQNKKNEIFNKAVNKDNHDTTYTMVGMGDEKDYTGADILREYKDPTNGRVYAAHDRYLAAARIIKVGSINKYYVKMSDNQEIFDPANVTHIRNAKVMRGGISLFNMRQVTKGRFDNYMSYLKSKNQRHYTQARKAI